MQHFMVPTLDALLENEPVPPVTLTVTFEEYRFRSFVQIHSSGSTGIPKLVTLKHGSFSAVDAFQALEPNEFGQRFANLRMGVAFPPFHVAGLVYALAAPCWTDSTVVIPPTVPLTADVINSMNVKAGVEFCLLIPSLVIDLVKNPAYLNNFKKFIGVQFAGGPLPESIGSQVAQRTKLISGYGAAEWIAAPQLPKQDEDWPFFNFNLKPGLEFIERDNGLYEFVIRRKPEYDLFQSVFVTFPDIDVFETKDLFSKHPSKPGLWKYVSRMDDIVVFSNGEKVNPVALESTVTTSPDVKGCVVIGQGRFQPVLLVEPSKETEDQAELLDRIWTYVLRANEPTIRHGRIAKDCIFFTEPDKALPWAGKGTIQRASANALYSHEIDEKYARLEGFDSEKATPGKIAAPKIDLSDLDTTRSSLARYICDDIGLEDLENTTDFFSLGMDSLQVVNIVRAVNLVRPSEPIDAKQVYDNPSVDELAKSLHSDPPSRFLHDDDSDDEELKQSWLAMDEMYNELTGQMLSRGDKSADRRRYLNAWFRSTNNGPVIQPDGGRVAWLASARNVPRQHQQLGASE